MFISMGKECESCKSLKEQLLQVNNEKMQMLNTLLSLAKPEVIQAPPTIVEPIGPKAMTWHERKRILEEEDRNKARAMREIDKTEEELGIKEDTAV